MEERGEREDKLKKEEKSESGSRIIWRHFRYYIIARYSVCCLNHHRLSVCEFSHFSISFSSRVSLLLFSRAHRKSEKKTFWTTFFRSPKKTDNWAPGSTFTGPRWSRRTRKTLKTLHHGNFDNFSADFATFHRRSENFLLHCWLQTCTVCTSRIRRMKKEARNGNGNAKLYTDKRVGGGLSLAFAWRWTFFSFLLSLKFNFQIVSPQLGSSRNLNCSSVRRATKTEHRKKPFLFQRETRNGTAKELFPYRNSMVFGFMSIAMRWCWWERRNCTKYDIPVWKAFFDFLISSFFFFAYCCSRTKSVKRGRKALQPEPQIQSIMDSTLRWCDKIYLLWSLLLQFHEAAHISRPYNGNHFMRSTFDNESNQ